MPTIYTDVILDTNGAYELFGWTALQRGIMVDEISLDLPPFQRISQGIEFLAQNGITINSPHPSIPNLWVDSIQPRPDSSGAAIIHYIVNYNNVNPTQRLLNYLGRNPAVALVITGSSNLSQEDTFVDANGQTITDANNVAKSLSVLKINPTYSITRRETGDSPIAKARTFSGTVNNAAYNGYGKWQLLLDGMLLIISMQGLTLQDGWMTFIYLILTVIPSTVKGLHYNLPS